MMPIQVSEIAGGAGVLYDCRGACTIHDLIEANLKTLAMPERLSEWYFGAVDQTHVEEFTLSQEELRAITVMDERLARISRKGFMVAVVAPRDIHFGMARMWQAFADAIGWKVEVFRDLETAHASLLQHTQKTFRVSLPEFLAEFAPGTLRTR